MKPLPPHSSANPPDLLGYQVVDRNGKYLGTLNGQWADPGTEALKFLGVNTGGLLGRNHLVPAGAAQFDEGERVIQVPYDAAFVREAPALEAGAEVTHERESEVLRHYATAQVVAPTTGTDAGAAAAAPYAGDDAIELALAEEQLRVGKRTVPTGTVRLRKIVVTEQVQVPVEVRREEVVIERLGPGEATGTDAIPFDGHTVEVVLHEEKAVVSKEIHVSGAVRLRKTVSVERVTVQEALRQEDVEVLRAGETGVWRQDATATDPPATPEAARPPGEGRGGSTGQV